MAIENLGAADGPVVGVAHDINRGAAHRMSRHLSMTHSRPKWFPLYRDCHSSIESGSRAAGRVLVHKARKVVHVQDRRGRGPIAVGPGIARGEAIDKAAVVVDV